MNIRDDWNTIRLIAEIARTGSFSGAAAAMGLNQATVSRRVVDIEEALGFIVFIRSSDGAQPTSQGAALVSQAESACARAAEFGRALADRSGGVAPVVVATTELIATHLLTPLALGAPEYPLRDEAEDLPPLRIVGRDGSATADILFAWCAPGAAAPFPDTMITRLVGRIPFTAFHGAAYAARHGGLPQTAADLAHHPTVTVAKMLVFDDPEALGPWIEATRGDTLVVDWTAAAERTISAGHAIGLLPCWMGERDSGLIPFSAGLPRMSLDLRIAADPQRLRDPDVRRAYDGLARSLASCRWTPDACRAVCRDGLPCRGLIGRNGAAG